MKRLIFDFDNTLIMWDNKYLVALDSIIKDYNLNANLEELDYALNHCDKHFGKLSVENMIKLAKKICNVDMSEEMIYDWADRLGKIAIDLMPGVEETLAYLSTKYDIVVLTNFLTFCQKKRAINAGIDQYINEYYGAEKSEVMKPHPTAFLEAIGDYAKEDCIMIGDSINADINGAIAFGIPVIYFDHDDVCHEETPYLTIKKITELKNIL